MKQQERSKINDPLGLYTVLKNIQNRKCSCGFLCIELGTIYGDWDKLRPRNITVPFNEEENVHVIIKPIIVMNNTKIPSPTPSPPDKNSTPIIPIDIFEKEEDCDELKMSGNGLPRFKQFNQGIEVKHQNVQRKFYRKVAIGENIYSQDIFKQGINVIIVQRDRSYTKLFEKTYDTNNSRMESDELAELLQNTPCSKIIILTGIGKWMGAMTPMLIKEIKQIGGPDLNNLFSPDFDLNSEMDHAMIIIGRRGLCRYNGIFRIKNYDLSKSMSKLFPDISSDPNDCFFDDVMLENNKNRLSEKNFFHLIDLRLTLNINNDNRFAWDAPTISTVSPFRGSVHGGMEVKIGGFNFGLHTVDIREIQIRGVICGDFILLGPNLISCITRASTILGPGPGNVFIKMRNGYESPKRTCNVFEYTGDPQESLNDLKRTIKTVQKMQDLPIYMNSNYHDQDVSIFDHLMFNKNYYKEKLKPNHTNHVAIKLDQMVRGSYHNLINVVNTPKGLLPPPEGFRKRRFRNVLNKLELCDEDKK
jgi:hypothetical protein